MFEQFGLSLSRVSLIDSFDDRLHIKYESVVDIDVVSDEMEADKRDIPTLTTTSTPIQNWSSGAAHVEEWVRFASYRTASDHFKSNML